MSIKGHVVVLKAVVPEGKLTADHFRIEEVSVDPNAIAADSVVVEALVFSADPYLRGRFKTSAGKVTGFIAGRVTFSKSAAFPVGALVGGNVFFQTVQVVEQASTAGTVWNISDYVTEDTISLGVGALGMPGATAWGGLMDVLRPKRGETIFISAASGAVGSLVGQIAANVVGCTVVGSCGGPEKGEAIKKLGFHHAIDYRKADSTERLLAAIKAVAPEGIDMNFENVGSYHFDAAFRALRPRGRVAVCGAISQYDAGGFDSKDAPNHINAAAMIYSCQRIEGFLAFPYLKEGKFLTDMKRWIDEKKVVIHESFFDGIEQWPAAMLSVMDGSHMGKVVVRLHKK